MNKLFIVLSIGIAAGIIDIIPMIFQKLDRYAISSAFIQWIIAAFVISYIQIGIDGWIKGGVMAVLMALPVVILVMKTDAKSVLPILVMSAILGSLVGFFSNRLIQ
ncbi:MAG: hypothetical protein N2484_17150 [Clostridia bacterium]|nr:hypothetical protein [Clostridia bacterium]